MDKKENSMHTQRLILRKFKPSDYEDYCNILGNNEVSRYLGTGKSIEKEHVKKMMNFMDKHWDKFGYGIWAVVEKQSNALVGHCGLKDFAEAKDTELLYAFGREFWGKGYATESAKAIVEFAKNHTDLQRLIAIAYPANKASLGVIEKLGFKYSGKKEFFGVDLAYYQLRL